MRTPLTPAAFRAALEKGQGRAWLHVQEHGTAGVEDDLLHACLHNLMYDAQCEDGRSWWLLEMVEQSPDPDRFAAAISAALPGAADDRDAWQLGNLALRLAEEGDEAARQALYARLENAPRNDLDGAAMVIDLDGLDGFLRVAERRGRRLLADPEGWDDEGALGQAEESCGADAVRAALEEAAARSTAVRAYLNAVDEARRKDTEEPRDFRAGLDLATILRDIEAGAGTFPGNYSRFGRIASQEDVDAVFSHLVTETRRDQQLRCLWVFLQRPVPRCDDLLLRLAESGDTKIQDAACTALSRTRDSRVRALALRLLERPEALPHSSLRLFSANLEAGDPERIEAALWVPEDRRDAHSICWDLLDLAKEHPNASFTACLLWVAEHNPCSSCRARALKLLIQRGTAPEPLLQECLHDADGEARELAEASF